MRINGAKKAVMGLAVAGVVMMTGRPVFAETDTAGLSIGADVKAMCTIATNAIAFGDYDPIVANASANLDGAGAVRIACTKSVSPNIGLGLGANASGAVRRMTNGTDFLSYELFSNSSRTTVWGNASGSWLAAGAATSKAERSFDVYGRVAPGQDVSVGAYTDSVVATVNF